LNLAGSLRTLRSELLGELKMKANVIAVVLMGMLQSPVAGGQQVSLQFNVAYQCQNDVTVIVSRCEQKGGSEYCFFRAGQNGHLGNEAWIARDKLANLTSVCSVRPVGASVKAGSQPAPAARRFDPPYLSEMPTAERVLSAMQTTDPRETALRQMGAFYQLMEIIKTLSGRREFRGYTPDEKRFLDEYSMAQYKVGQEADAAFPGPYRTERQLSLYTPYRYSRNDPRFGFEGIPVWQAFFSPALQRQFAQITGAQNARYEARVAEERRTAAAALEANSTEAAGPGQSQSARNDPGTLAARRCAESGRDQAECVGEGLKVGIKDLFGPVLGGVMAGEFPGAPAFTGLRMSGDFSGSGFTVGFTEDSAILTCGKLVPAAYNYEVERIAGQVKVKIQNDPKPLVLALRPDGKLAGPGLVAVAGRVVTGYSSGGGSSAPGYEMQTHTTTQQRQIAAADVRSPGTVHQNGMEYSVSEQVTSTSYEPTAPQPSAPVAITAPKTERCNVGILPGTPSAKLSKVMMELLDPSQKAPAQPMGLRMKGTYVGQGGLSIEFRSDSATVECAPAHVAMAYEVVDVSGQVTIKVQNRATPFTLLLRRDGTLQGSGIVDVLGRVITGSRGDEIVYAPTNARCTIGSLTPKN
jgi:hypothetical protein